ncbi:MAG: helix-turn-helix transcriptional regulator [Clostridia bacterium]|nr:helix-turn-helix transcriptional regulator [Clostridia bacterium]
MNITTLGKQIAQMRRKKGITQEELANHVGVSTQAVSKWENGGAPDVELLPRIADFFSVSIDALFGRSILDYEDPRAAIVKKLITTPDDEKFKLAFDYCWDVNRSLMPGSVAKYFSADNDSVDALTQSMKPNEQRFSSIRQNNGFTMVGIGNRQQYFLLVPEPKDTDLAYFNGIDYPAFFACLGDKDVFQACVLAYKRHHKNAFTAELLVKELGITLEKAKEVLKILVKYEILGTGTVEIDGKMQEIYHCYPNTAFAALLIFAEEIIDKTRNGCYCANTRTIPYFQ